MCESRRNCVSLLTSIIRLLELRRRYVADRFQNTSVVEPVDPFECLEPNRPNLSPRAAATDHLGFAEPNDRFGDGESPVVPTDARMPHSASRSL
jgi:hypothetical protein